MKSFDILSHKYGKYAWILALFFVLLPILLVSFVPGVYNPLVQVLFDFMLFSASLWFGISVSNKEAEKRATDKWLVAAGNACMELASMREVTKRMMLKQGTVCQSVEKIIPGIPPKELGPLKELMTLNCTGCANNIADLQNRIENIRQGYSTFVNANCEETECASFHELFDRREKEIQATFDSISFIKS